MSRQQERGDLPPEVRIRMAEDDLDRVDHRLEELPGVVKHARGNLEVLIQAANHKTDRLETKFDQLEHDLEDKVDGNRKIMVGVLVSTLSVAIGIVAQVLIMRGGS